MMKLLFAIMLLTLTTASCAASTNMLVAPLDQQMKIQRESITAECTREAKSLMYVTGNRDAGVPLAAVLTQLLNMAEEEFKNKTLQPPLKLTDVLYQVAMTTIIYHSPMTEEEIFNSQFRICEKELLEILNYMYERAIEIQWGVMLRIPMKNKFKNIIIPIIRKAMPGSIASEIVGVQPMQDETFDTILNIVKDNENKIYTIGEPMHSFLDGWCRWDGKKFIPEELYFDLKIKGLL